MNSTANVAPRTNDKQNTYVIKPQFDQKYRPSAVKTILSKVLRERLENEVYSSQTSHDEIKQTLKNSLALERYRYLVQVVLGEQKGQGVKVAYRCYWDTDTDNYAEASFTNDSLFCVASAFDKKIRAKFVEYAKALRFQSTCEWSFDDIKIAATT